MKAMAILALGALLGGCTTTVASSVARPDLTPVPSYRPGANRLLGNDSAGLIAQFGAPEADVREGSGRKLQFAGPACVLDAYLYPKGSGPATVTFVDARLPDGSPADGNACAAALSRRGAPR
ncbi:MAG: hypothetical protein B7Y45_12910 [Sphingomonas sp. 28-66-16]|nr:MAG: hypothetical protein B7Y45_12910 [Sphingomonas sp. 28-66-16]